MPSHPGPCESRPGANEGGTVYVRFRLVNAGSGYTVVTAAVGSSLLFKVADVVAVVCPPLGVTAGLFRLLSPPSSPRPLPLGS
jgi:hypothetical protein